MPDGIMNDLETESHVGAGITIGYREDVDPVDIFPALKKMPYSRGQAPNHSGRVNICDGVGQILCPENKPNKILARQRTGIGEKYRVLAGFEHKQPLIAQEFYTGPYGTFGMEPASVKLCIRTGEKIPCKKIHFLTASREI